MGFHQVLRIDVGHSGLGHGVSGEDLMVDWPVKNELIIVQIKW